MVEMSPVETLIDPDACERIVHAALAASDMRGVEAALTALAVQDPRRAQALIDVMQLGLDLASRTAGEETRHGR